MLGYHDILVTQDAFDHDLQFDQALEMIPRLEEVARSRGKRLGVKFSNTLVVKNHKTFFSDDVMYMSGAPLHVVTLNLVQKFRAATGSRIPTSFSAGLDANNVANCVAMNFVPVTACTDLLRPGGYGRLVRYLERLGERMREVGAPAIPDLIVRHAGQGEAAIRQAVAHATEEFQKHAGGDNAALAPARWWLMTELGTRLKLWLDTPGTPLSEAAAQIAQAFHLHVAPQLHPTLAAALEAELANLPQVLVDAAGLLNTPVLVKQATEDPRYAWASNKGVPRKIGSKLWLYDCINCDKCVPDCPNDANFVYDTTPVAVAYQNFKLLKGGGVEAIAGGIFQVAKAHQLANYADACNDCGNCDVFCPEDGGPQVEKPRFFGSWESYRRYAGQNGFFIEYDAGSRTIHGTIAGKSYVLTLATEGDRAWFDNGSAELEIHTHDHSVVTWKAKPSVNGIRDTADLLPYLQLKMLLESASDPRRVHYANVAGLERKKP